MVDLTIPDELLNQVTQAVEAHQPKLGVSISNGVIVLEGPFVLFSSMGPLDFYGVRIEVFGDFPQEGACRIRDRRTYSEDPLIVMCSQEVGIAAWVSGRNGC